MDEYNIIIRPVITEQGMHFANTRNAYSFEVNKKANKIQIRKAVEDLFGVRVVDVNTQHVGPKLKRVGTSAGYARSWKKAVVRLAPGQTIELY